MTKLTKNSLWHRENIVFDRFYLLKITDAQIYLQDLKYKDLSQPVLLAPLPLNSPFTY